MSSFPEFPDLEILSKVGEGGMAVVWKALDRRHNRIVAVKILKPEFAANAEDAQNFAAEAHRMEMIDHEGIVKSYGLFASKGQIYYVMEFVDGYCFGDFIAKRHTIKESDCLLICESVASALDYAWNDFGIVHCDIKPDNIMINAEGVVKLTDLGLSRTFRFLKDEQIDVPDHVLGTPAYISPEQVFGDTELDCRSDIYSLAATLYHLATGCVLFPNLDAESMMRAHCDESKQAADPRNFTILSEGFCQLLEAMLVKDRDYRLPTWKDVFTMCSEIERGYSFKPRATPGVSSLALNQ